MRPNTTLLLAASLLMGVGLFAGLHFSARPALEAKESPTPRMTGRVGYVNIAELLKGYTKANTRGQKLADLRQVYVQDALEMRNKMVELKAMMDAEKNDQRKEELRDKALKIQRKLEDLERASHKELGEMSEKVIVDVYHEIKEVIAELGKEMDFDCIMIYPDGAATKPMTSAIAQSSLQAPAAYPFYTKGELNLTEEALKRLNKKFPTVANATDKHED